MAQRQTLRVALSACATAFCLCAGVPSHADDQPVTPEELRRLLQQNKALQEQLRHQQALIDSLNSKVNHLERNAANSSSESSTAATESSSSSSGLLGSALNKVSISAEGGIAFFNTGSQGMFPHSEFRVDEAKLFVEAAVWNRVYFFSEINLATREQPDVLAHLGECYLDFENVSQLWGWERMLNVRLGRMYAPFGEEYQRRYAIDNPLISHSLSDLWAVDEGLELYGKIGAMRYAFAVQNGGISDTADFNSDKAIAGRIEYDPRKWLHLSVSGMRTGDLDARRDSMSATWFGNGFFRSIGSLATTTKFHANLIEGDIGIWLPHGHLSAFGGYIDYGDNDSAANNHRDLYYYSVEAVHDIVGNLYAGARFSQIFAPRGFPIVANGDFGTYLFDPTALTREIWRLSLGLGYRFSPNLVLKGEYSFERGKEQSGENRDHEDLFALEAAFKF